MLNIFSIYLCVCVQKNMPFNVKHKENFHALTYSKFNKYVKIPN